MNQNINLPEFFKNQLNQQYDEQIIEKIIKGYCQKRKTTLRINTLKASIDTILTQFEQLGIAYERVLWSNEAVILKEVQEKQIQTLEMYEKGEIYLQSLSSMLPPIILNPKPSTDILDMTAAPGGKTTQIAALTQNKAHITACERNVIRAKRLKYNIEKQGASSVYVMLADSTKMDDCFAFDTILLDAPCSGSGTLSSQDSHISEKFTIELLEKCQKWQLSLLQKAMNLLKPGQEMVYSTCSILACENEEIVERVLHQTKSEIVPIEFSGMETLPTLPVKLKRYFVHLSK